MRRILSAAVLLSVAFVVTRHLPAFAFLILVLVFMVPALLEFCALTSRRGFAPQAWSAAAGAIALAYAFYDPRVQVLEVFAGVALVIPIFSLMRRDPMEEKFGNMVMTVFPVLFLGLLFGYLVALRLVGGQDGHDLPFLLLLVVAAADTGAYYGGRSLGRHLLAPRLSPNKTIEGLVIGVGCGIGAAFLARFWFMHRLEIADCLILGVVLALTGAAGDLVESALKRWAGAKDASNLIPGHGGILDRIDALLFAAPVLFYYHLHFMVSGLP